MLPFRGPMPLRFRWHLTFLSGFSVRGRSELAQQSPIFTALKIITDLPPWKRLRQQLTVFSRYTSHFTKHIYASLFLSLCSSQRSARAYICTCAHGITPARIPCRAAQLAHTWPSLRARHLWHSLWRTGRSCHLLGCHSQQSNGRPQTWGLRHKKWLF